jgi:hypothetical protein
MYCSIRCTGLPRYVACLTALFLLYLLAPAEGADRALRVVPEVWPFKASHALIIGVSDYTNGWPDLPGVAEDIAAVRTALQEQGFEVMVVKDPTSAALREAFDTFIRRHGLVRDHRLLIYFAGHGHTIRQSYDEKMGYIVPADAPNPRQDADGFLATAMDMLQIEVYAKRIQAKHALFLFDSCFSGTIFSLSRAVPEHISYKTSHPVRQFITAGDADEQVSDESMFRRQFIAALRGEADGDRDGYVTGTELGEFLTNTVINYSKNAQHPKYGKIRHRNLDKGDFIFNIPATGQESKVAPLPPPAHKEPLSIDTAQPKGGQAGGVPGTPQSPRAYNQWIQRLLKQGGLDPGPADGMFGRRTEDALRRYQASRSLPVTGLPDEATEKAMQADASRWRQERPPRIAETEPSPQTRRSNHRSKKWWQFWKHAF